MKKGKASFKGIIFDYEDHENETGRRGQIHEYPNRDTPWFEDMGAKAKSFSFNAFFIGEDCEDKADKLINAFNSGAGTLNISDVSIEVICTSCVKSIKSSEIGIIRLGLSFIEAGKQILPDENIDYAETANIKANNLEDVSITNFITNFKATSALSSASGVVESYADNFSNSLNLLNVSNSTSSLDTITSAISKADDMKQNSLDILKTPDIFASKVSTCFNVFNSFVGRKETVSAIKSSTVNVDNDVAKINTSNTSGKEEAESMKQVAVLTERIAIANEAKVITSSDYESTKEASETLNDFNKQIEEQLLTTTPTDYSVFVALKELRAAVFDFINNEVKKLPNLKKITVHENTPSIVLAYELYEDSTRSDEIALRNEVINPGFVKKGEIEVLSE